MKTLLLTATTVGAAIAGIILYFRKSRRKAEELNRFHTIGSTVPGERNMAHSMG
ncbi:MAG: hypothetical protein ACXWV9_06935 [Flavisolibacter sp.]